MKIALTAKNILTLPAPLNKPCEIYFDHRMPGFGLKITKADHRTFILRRRFNGTDRTLKIGDVGSWTIEMAREYARELVVKGDKGIDPQIEKYDERNAPRIADLWQDYQKEILSTKAARAQVDQAIMYRKDIGPSLGNIRVKDIDHADCMKLHRKITDSGRKARANRVLEVVRSMLNFAVKLKMRPDNPAIGFTKNPLQPRHRYLDDQELQRLKASLDGAWNQKSADVIRLLLLTGARKGEVLSATWNQFDLSQAVWVKPSAHTKQRREHRVPLSPPAVALLQKIRQRTNSRYVFPQDDDPERHMTDIKKFWATILRISNIQNLRIHDLRHSYASFLVSAGLSFPIIGALLGHTQAQTTHRYAHLHDAPLRDATDKAAQIINL